jgi:hypothetical protein
MTATRIRGVIGIRIATGIGGRVMRVAEVVAGGRRTRVLVEVERVNRRHGMVVLTYRGVV